MDKLLSCPFCGSEGRLLEMRHFQGLRGDGIESAFCRYAACSNPNCGAANQENGPFFHIDKNTWNQRVNSEDSTGNVCPVCNGKGEIPTGEKERVGGWAGHNKRIMKPCPKCDVCDHCDHWVEMGNKYCGDCGRKLRLSA